VFTRQLLPFAYIAILGVTFLYFFATAGSATAAFWIGSAFAEMTMINFWVIAILFGYFAVKFDVAIIAFVVSLVSAAIYAKTTQKLLVEMGETANLGEVFVSKIIALFTAYLVVFCLFAFVNLTVNGEKKAE